MRATTRSFSRSRIARDLQRPARSRGLARASAFAWTALLTGCGPAAFSPAFQEREEPELSRVLEELRTAPARDESAALVGVTRDGALVGWDLRENRQLFHVEAEVSTTPVLAGRYVVATEPSGVVVRRLDNGERAFALTDRELRLVGADGEGDSLVVSLARGQGDSPLGVVVGARGGSARWMEELPLPVASPALVGGVAVVPWAHQRISFLDAERGRERLRLRLRDAVVGHALRHGSRVVLGQHELFELDADLVERSARGDDFVRPRGRPLPGQPPLMADGYAGRVAPDGAPNRVRLAWALASGDGELGFADGLVYYVFYRMVFALDASADEVRWVHTLASDCVGVAAGEGGVMVATEDGSVRWLAAADGRETWRTELGAPLRAAEIRLASFSPEPTAEGAAEPLRAQLERAASLDDPRLDGGRAFAIGFLARFADDEVTERLIALCAPRAVLGPARRAACEALAARTTGATFVRDALRRRASFLEDVPPPPVGALARAAAAMGQRMTVPLLLQHLADPATPADELPGLFEGLAALGDARAVPPIEAFLRLYHADATDGRDADALAAAATALLALAPDRFELVQELAGDPFAPEHVRERLARALTEHRSTRETPPREEPAARRTPPPPPADDRPARITEEMRRAAFGPIEVRLRRCLAGSSERSFPSARISMVVDAEGRPRTIRVVPEAVQPCMEPLLRGLTFPPTRRGSEAIVHVVRR